MYKLNIPDKINIGFQNRTDTYTGKLAFIIYTDDKGTLRKEKSWNNWRNCKIEPQEFENIPTEGFVLNKKVGDGGYGWISRKAWTRVYDPRGFEFEIDIENLIFILEECSSIKGKGLEGEFVYAWDSAKLLLLPVSSKEYKESIGFKKACTKKITKEDMKEGCCYLTKEGNEVMYLGRLPHWDFSNSKDKIEYKSKKKQIFVNLNLRDYKIKNKANIYPIINSYGEHTQLRYYKEHPRLYFIQSGFTQLISKLNDEPCTDFAEEFEKYKESKYGSPPKSLIAGDKGDTNWNLNFIKKGKQIHYAYLYLAHNGYYQPKSHMIATEPIKIIPGKSITIPISPTSQLQSKFSNLDIISLYVITESGFKFKLGD